MSLKLLGLKLERHKFGENVTQTREQTLLGVDIENSLNSDKFVITLCRKAGKN